MIAPEVAQMPRRGNREGTFGWEPADERRKYGRWKGALLISGVGRLTVTGRKGESKASVRERLHAKRDGYADVRNPTKGTLAEWCDLWLRLYLSKKAPRTREYYRAMLGHLLPHLGSQPVGRITSEALLGALDKIERPATRRKAYEVLRIALNRAVKTGRIRANVCATIDPPEVTPKVVEPPTAAEVGRILAAVRGQRDEALIVVALATGLRQGEIVGLRWMDLEVGDGPMRDQWMRSRSDASGGVGQQSDDVSMRPARTVASGGGVIHVRGQLDRDRQYVGAKRGSERIAGLPPTAVAALTAHRERVTLAQGRHPEPTDYIFGDAHGRPMTGFEAYRRWQVALKAAGVALRPFHATRHYAHSKMEEAGMNGPMIDAIFGHVDERMRGQYTHATEEARAMAAETMERALGG